MSSSPDLSQGQDAGVPSGSSIAAEQQALVAANGNPSPLRSLSYTDKAHIDKANDHLDVGIDSGNEDTAMSSDADAEDDDTSSADESEDPDKPKPTRAEAKKEKESRRVSRFNERFRVHRRQIRKENHRRQREYERALNKNDRVVCRNERRDRARREYTRNLWIGYESARMGELRDEARDLGIPPPTQLPAYMEDEFYNDPEERLAEAGFSDEEEEEEEPKKPLMTRYPKPPKKSGAEALAKLPDDYEPFINSRESSEVSDLQDEEFYEDSEWMSEDADENEYEHGESDAEALATDSESENDYSDSDDGVYPVRSEIITYKFEL